MFSFIKRFLKRKNNTVYYDAYLEKVEAASAE